MSSRKSILEDDALGPLKKAIDGWQGSYARLQALGATAPSGLQSVVRYKYGEVLREARDYADKRVAQEVPTAVPYAWVHEGVRGALNGYLRVSSSGGMPKSDENLVRACVEQMLELGYLDIALGERVLKARGTEVPAAELLTPEDLIPTEDKHG